MDKMASYYKYSTHPHLPYSWISCQTQTSVSSDSSVSWFEQTSSGPSADLAAAVDGPAIKILSSVIIHSVSAVSTPSVYSSDSSSLPPEFSKVWWQSSDRCSVFTSGTVAEESLRHSSSSDSWLVKAVKSIVISDWPLSWYFTPSWHSSLSGVFGSSSADWSEGFWWHLSSLDGDGASSWSSSSSPHDTAGGPLSWFGTSVEDIFSDSLSPVRKKNNNNKCYLTSFLM